MLYPTIIIFCIMIYILSRYFVVQYQNYERQIDIKNVSQVWMPQLLENDIHLVIVSANTEFNDMALSLIKSIIFHRRKYYNLTFHIFTDGQRWIMLPKYFEYISNVCINFRLYKIESLIKFGENFLEKHNITITHYSGRHAFSKVFIHEFLPLNVSRIILLDVDIIFFDDIYSIWEQFQLFKSDISVLGLAPWYPPVPIDYKYVGSAPDLYITGVVLFDIKMTRSIKFTQLMSNTTDIALKQFQLKKFWTADQTILSLFAMYFPQYIVALPCFVNGHISHYLRDGPTWKSACNNQYPRTAHVVPSRRLKNSTDYFGHLYIFYRDMPIEWLSYCVKPLPST
jgi:hypothetical protein